MTKTISVFRDAPPKEDYSWALALDDGQRIDLATRLVADLWSASHGGEPFPAMDRTVVKFTALANNL
jgi:hypothetical protein